MRKEAIEITSKGDFIFDLKVGNKIFQQVTMEQIIEILRKEERKTNNDNG